LLLLFLPLLVLMLTRIKRTRVAERRLLLKLWSRSAGEWPRTAEASLLLPALREAGREGRWCIAGA
jgi:hypothetical protein